MALDSYANLKTAVADWLNKTSLTNISARAAEFITLFEAQASRELDTMEMVESRTVTISGEEMALPHDFAGARSFRINGNPDQPLTYAKPEEFEGAYSTGKPTRYTVTDKFIFDPAPDASYEARLIYRQRIPALSASRTTNWLLKKHPDAYLYGSLAQGLIYLHDEDRQTVSAAYANALSAIARDDKRAAYPATVNASARCF